MVGSRALIGMLASGLACLALLGGCGGSTARRDPAQEARAIAEANAFCLHVRAVPPSRRSEQEVSAIRARFAALERRIAKTAAYRPAGKALDGALAARGALMSELRKHLHGGFLTGAPDPIDRLYRLQLKVYEAERELGLSSCFRPPRQPISG